LLSRNILAMSFAPRDSHEAQVQFALERGVPAMIGVLASNRLTYPARSFDMAHCSRCLIPWQLYGMLHYGPPMLQVFRIQLIAIYLFFPFTCRWSIPDRDRSRSAAWRVLDLVRTTNQLEEALEGLGQDQRGPECRAASY